MFDGQPIFGRDRISLFPACSHSGQHQREQNL